MTFGGRLQQSRTLRPISIPVKSANGFGSFVPRVVRHSVDGESGYLARESPIPDALEGGLFLQLEAPTLD